MEELLKSGIAGFGGEISLDLGTRARNSQDASIYEQLPDAVVAPKTVADVKRLVKFVNKHRHAYPSLALTPRSAGTDMSGAAIGHSIVVRMTDHFDTIHRADARELHVQPGVFMRDIDPALADKNAMLGFVPASRALCTIGGMVANNSGGEQSLRYGNADRSVERVKAVLADGNEYEFGPLSRRELAIKIEQGDFEGELYRNVYELIEHNYDLVHNARPKVNKNSMGYNLWSVWDRDTGVFNMAQLFTGSQGTLGLLTDLHIRTVKKAPYSGLLLGYLTNLKQLGDIIPLVMEHAPATFEGFDDITFNLGVKYFSTFRKQLGTKEWLKQQAWLLQSVAKFRGHLPNVVLMIEFDGDSQAEVDQKIRDLQADFTARGIRLKTDVEGSPEKSAPFWSIRRASLALLRHQVHGKYASAFMDDLTVQPQFVPQFFPEVRKIIRKYDLPATIAGHFGDGNFHIIPLMAIGEAGEQGKLEPAMRELIPLVLKYKGTLAGEHNDGMVRGPWLPAVFGDELYQLFRETKEIFDPNYIFNPHKKTDATWEYSMQHVRSNRTRNLYK